MIRSIQSRPIQLKSNPNARFKAKHSKDMLLEIPKKLIVYDIFSKYKCLPLHSIIISTLRVLKEEGEKIITGDLVVEKIEEYLKKMSQKEPRRITKAVFAFKLMDKKDSEPGAYEKGRKIFLKLCDTYTKVLLKYADVDFDTVDFQKASEILKKKKS